MDTYSLNALVNNLMAPGPTFDPQVASDLFEGLPEESQSRITFAAKVSGTRAGMSGMTSRGGFSDEEKYEKGFKLGCAKGLWLGNWRVFRTHDTLHIEPRFLESSEPGTVDSYEIRFGRWRGIQFFKSDMRTLRIGPVAITWLRWKPWKESAEPE